jgi:formylglycine-generating enzyme required for sulfatase activity
VSDPRWTRIEEIVEAALELAGDARREYVASACGGDLELQAEVERLLGREGSGGPDFLEPPEIEPPQPGAGKHSLGEFELLRELGRGGMGVVYLARQERLRREVAVKVLVAGLTTTERDIERFHREARATARLRHPGIVQVFADGQVGGTHWFAMEYVPGHDLQREILLQKAQGVLAQGRPILPRPGEPEHAATIARICADVADALHCAHEHGLVHRDVKPQNLLLQENRRVQVGDFGLVRDEALGSLTRTGELAGTPYYMSPEQARIVRASVDHRTDVYSLGVVMYELATLQRPFEGKTSADILTKIRDTHPSALRSLNGHLPRDLETICLKAMAKEPRDRYATAADLRDDLRRFLAHEAIVAKPPTWLAHAGRWMRRHRYKVGAFGLLVGGIAGGAEVAAKTVEARGMARISAEAVDADGNPLRGEVSVRAVDSVTGAVGPPEALGDLPLDGVRLKPGYYRVVVDAEGLGPRELTRDLRGGQETPIKARLEPRGAVREGMVRIPAGTVALQGDRRNPPSLRYHRVPVEAFWLDAREVSNGQYRAFLEATKHEPPLHWARIVPGEHDDLPVVYVGWEDARAYAEWAGKRLPSAAEWYLAACGEEGRIYPWPGAVPGGELFGNVSGSSLPPREESEHGWVDAYLANAKPVDSSPEASTESGIYNLFGNVSEWLETQAAEPHGDVYTLLPDQRLYAGGDWRAKLLKRDVTICGWAGPERAYGMPVNGFRCALTDQP